MNDDDRPIRADQAGSGKSPHKWPVLLLLAAMVIVPALFWQRVWFGSRLSDAEIRRRLSQPENPRQVQHACEQISRRMQRDPAGARRLYDLLLPLADHADDQVRSVAAWCMGEDSGRYPPFHQALRGLASDQAPGVRYNAALALARFGDAAARPVLREMLDPFTVLARWEGAANEGAGREGVVVDLLSLEDPVRPRMQLALVAAGPGEPKPVLAPLGGRVGRLLVRLGDTIAEGQPLCAIDPEFPQLYESLRALALTGDWEDLDSVERRLAPEGRFSRSERARLQAQARLTADAIRNRAQKHAQKREEQKNRTIAEQREY